MKSEQRGRNTLAIEVTNVSPHGFWLLMDERERFVPFSKFPWFRDATIAELTKVELPSPHHLYWPALDVDLAVDSLGHPEQYPLLSRDRPDRRRQTARSRRGARSRAKLVKRRAGR